MNNTLKKAYDTVSIAKGISERKQIIQRYKSTRYLDREDAINKIRELRLSDAEVAAVTTAQLAVSSTPFEQASDQGILNELQMQIDILTAKLAEIAAKEMTQKEARRNRNA